MGSVPRMGVWTDWCYHRSPLVTMMEIPSRRDTLMNQSPFGKPLPPPDSDQSSEEFEAFRSYLHVLAETQLQARLKSKVDASDIVQQTLLQAYRARDQFQGTSRAEKAGWLRRILGNVLFSVLRDYSRQRRDVGREQSIQAVEQSSLLLGNLLASEVSSPSNALHREEQAAQLAEAMLELTEEQRQAIILKYWHNASLVSIAEQLGKSPEAVAGLIFRGMRRLRSRMRQGDEDA
ncbi:MAG: DNA-directed RNA polymerase sigma-70 factor [Pirellulaceae bacterium]|nr:MAG: DNA-directed RNA polymerase sigma-70 factor [Pirellulaceae bacterium]